MIKRPFFCLAKPKLPYPVLRGGEKDAVREIPLPSRVTLLLERPVADGDALLLRSGARVQTGQSSRLAAGTEDHWVSTVTGSIGGLEEHSGYLGKIRPAMSIEVEEDEWDEGLSKLGDAPAREDLAPYLGALPGYPRFAPVLRAEPPLKTLIVMGMDRDLMVTTNQLVLLTQGENLKKGIELLKSIAAPGELLLAVPPHLQSSALEMGADVRVIEPVYPSAFPRMILKNNMKTEVPAGGEIAETGIRFINAEAVAALGDALSSGNPPVHKIITVIHKDYRSEHVKARIGTPVGDILAALGVETGHGDGLVLGGPMTGEAIFSEDTPVSYDTDAIMIQAGEEVPFYSDNQCINCGECIRACPANIPINMLVRLLENGLYDEAADRYDLHSCIECGLCSYVCIAQIPVFHYIMMGKHEVARMRTLEESHAE
jgi:electron transport complex protein RnfC